MKKKKINQKKEIVYNIINSLLAGILVLLGALADGIITIEGIGVAAIAALIVAVSQFKKYWDKKEKEYCNTKIFSFINY